MENLIANYCPWKKGSSSCNCSLKVESPSLQEANEVGEGWNPSSPCSPHKEGLNEVVISKFSSLTHWEVSASQAQVMDDRKGNKNAAYESAEGKVLLLLTHHKPRTDSLKGHQHQQFPLTALKNTFNLLSKAHLLFSTQVSQKYFSHSLYTCQDLISAINRIFFFKTV